MLLNELSVHPTYNEVMKILFVTSESCFRSYTIIKDYQKGARLTNSYFQTAFYVIIVNAFSYPIRKKQKCKLIMFIS